MQIRWKKQIAAAALTAAVLTVGSLSGPRKLMAQVRAALVQDVDSPGRAPFEVQVNLSLSGVSGTGVTIPAGKRLVIDHISANLSGPSAGTQPYIVMFTTAAGSGSVSTQLAIPQSPLALQQFDYSAPETLYADTLFVSLAFAGSAPPFLTGNVSIHGHLVSLT
jgi:hypothetical protein